MSALVSFERVFEILDIKPLILDRPDARPLSRRAGRGGARRRRFGYPSADKVSLASLEEVAKLDTRGGEEVLHGVSFRAEPGQMVALVGSSGAGKSTIAQLVPRLYDVDAGAVRLAGVDVRDLSAESIRDGAGCRHPGRASLPRDASAPTWRSLSRTPPRTRCGRCCGGPASTTWSARFPTGSTPSSVNAGTGCRAGNGNGSPSRGCCWPVRAWSSSTRPPRISTPPPRPRFRRLSPKPWPAARAWSSPTGSRPSGRPTRSSSSRTDASSSAARHGDLLAAGGR